MTLFPNFTSIPFDYLSISWVTNYVSNLGFLTCFNILDRIDRELLYSFERLELKFGFSSEFFDKIPVRILLDLVLFRVFRFSNIKRLFCPDIFIHDILKLRRHLDTDTYGRLPWQFCLQINAEISRQN